VVKNWRFQVSVCLVLLILGFSHGISLSYGQDVNLEDQVKQVYLEVVEVERVGADVSGVAEKLNRALQLVGEAENTDDSVEKSKLLKP